MIVTIVPQEAVDFMWPKCIESLTPAVQTADKMLGIQDVYLGIKMGYYGLWVVMEEEEVIASFTTRFLDFPKRKGMAMDFMGGTRMKEWLPKVDKVLMDYALENGCSHFEAYGRRAWGKWLGELGWEPDHICYKKELKDG
jgi:hypothetical protein|tara:strand:- start:218 stop:637 length:420 start_codon:yes stop_codon:yes gene_type:complete